MNTYFHIRKKKSYIERRTLPILQPGRRIRAVFLAECLALFAGRTDTCGTQIRNRVVDPSSLPLVAIAILKCKTSAYRKRASRRKDVIFIRFLYAIYTFVPRTIKRGELSMDRWKRERARADNAAKRVDASHAYARVHVLYIRALQEIRRTWNSHASAMYRDVPGISWNFETPQRERIVCTGAWHRIKIVCIIRISCALKLCQGFFNSFFVLKLVEQIHWIVIEKKNDNIWDDIVTNSQNFILKKDLLVSLKSELCEESYRVIQQNFKRDFQKNDLSRSVYYLERR